MAGPGGDDRRRRSRRRGPFASSEAESATTPHARTQPASGRSGQRTGRAALGSRRLQLLGGGFSAEGRPASLTRFRGGDGCFCPHPLPPASQAAGKKLGRALLRWRPRAGRAVGEPRPGPGPAAPRVTRLLGGPSPGSAPSRRRGRGPSKSGRAPGACAGQNSCRGVARVHPMV